MNRSRSKNSFPLRPLIPWMVLALLLLVAGLGFVVVKNQQHQIGQAIRQVERGIRDERAVNEVLVAQISRLSSRGELQRRVQEGLVALAPIQDHAIARLFPPTFDEEDQILRTASAMPSIR